MTSIQMPQLGETIVEGTILKWLKHEGDAVARDEALFEISTDKVDTEVPSPVAGTVTKILVDEGATVPVGTIVMEVAEEGAPAAAAPAPWRLLQMLRRRRLRAAEPVGRRRGVDHARRRLGRSGVAAPHRSRHPCRIADPARRSCPRSCAGSRGSTPSTSVRSRAPGPAGGSRRATCSP